MVMVPPMVLSITWMENQAHKLSYNPKHSVTTNPFAVSVQNVHILPKWSQPWDIYPPVSAVYVLCRRELRACAKISSLCKMPEANKRHPNPPLLCVQVKPLRSWLVQALFDLSVWLRLLIPTGGLIPSKEAVSPPASLLSFSLV